MYQFTLRLTVTGFCALLATALPAQEWTRFRGPNGTGVSDATTIPVEWTADDYNWRTKLPGTGNASPVVWGDKVFIVSADSQAATLFVNGIHTKHGDILWQRDFAKETHNLHARSSYASSTPTVDEDRLYVAFASPSKAMVVALTHDGDPVWERDLGPWTGWHGFGTSPILHDGMLILHNSQQADQLEPGQAVGKSSMLALDAVTGDKLWETPLKTKRVCYSVPFVYEPPGGGPAELVCTSTSEGVFSIDPSSGKRNWAINDVFAMRTVASPILAGGLILGSTGSGRYASNYVAAVRPGANASLAYKLENSSRFKAPYVPCAVARGDTVFLIYDKGFAACIDAPSGEIHWMQRLRGGFNGSPVRVRDKIYCIEEGGEVVVLAAAKEFQELARNPLGEISRSTPAVAGGRMYLRTNSHLLSVGG